MQRGAACHRATHSNSGHGLLLAQPLKRHLETPLFEPCLSEDMLSHVLAGRKDLSLASLTAALERIGYRLRIVPGSDSVMAGARKRKRTG